MNKLNKYLLALTGLFMLVFSSCKDTVDYHEASQVQGEGVYFLSNQATNLTLDSETGSISLEIFRTYFANAISAELDVTIPEASTNLISAPTSVSFAAEQSKTDYVITYKDLVEGVKYPITITVVEGTPYGKTTLDMTLTYVSPNTEVWNEVSTKGIYTDNLFSMFGVSDIVMDGVVVEKQEDKEIYRFQSPYNNAYFEEYISGASLFPSDFEYPYIILDLETYKKTDGTPLLYIPPTSLGFQMVNGSGPILDAEWDTFGSLAVNWNNGYFAPDNTSYPLGSYDETIKKFEFGVCYQKLGNYSANNGYFPITNYSFTLYLDPSLMVPDYDRDYTWTDVEDAEGYFKSELFGNWMQNVQVADQDATFYRFQNLYANGTSIYFNYDDDSFVFLKAQPTGLVTADFGNKIYLEAIARGTTVDRTTNVFNMQFQFYLADEDGKKAYELGQSNEVFTWGKGPLDSFRKDVTADDFVGAWRVPFYNYSKDEFAGYAGVEISKADEETLLISGLSLLSSYDDTAAFGFDASTGLISFIGQPVASHTARPYPTYIAPFNYETGMLSLSATLVGGLNEDGTIQIINTPDSDGDYNSLGYFYYNNGYGLLGS